MFPMLGANLIAVCRYVLLVYRFTFHPYSYPVNLIGYGQPLAQLKHFVLYSYTVKRIISHQVIELLPVSWFNQQPSLHILLDRAWAVQSCTCSDSKHDLEHVNVYQDQQV